MYYIIDPVTYTYYTRVHTYDNLVYWFAWRNTWFPQSNRNFANVVNWDYNLFRGKNSALDDIAMNYNDTILTYVGPAGYVLVPRRIMVLDKDLRIVDPRLFWRDIATWTHKSVNKITSKFRSGPVPGTGKRRGESYYRSPRTTQEIRLSKDQDTKAFVRVKRTSRYLPNTWDDVRRNTNHCWKSRKIKRQWMKHV